MEFFIGLAFDPSSIHEQKIESFRKRFDSKMAKSQVLQLTILPPFAIDFKNKEEESELIEEIADMLDTHLMGLDEIGQIEFNGITFDAHALSLTPKMSPDFIYVQESLYSILKDYGVKFKKTHDLMKSILPIGRFEGKALIDEAVEVAKVEFSSPFVMNATSFIIFEKKPSEWRVLNNLYEFDARNRKTIVNQNYV